MSLSSDAVNRIGGVFQGRSGAPGYTDTRGRVPFTEEFRRVQELPRLPPYRGPGILAELLTSELKTAAGTMTLREVQAVALDMLHNSRGLVGDIPVGEGKTLISFLAAVAVQASKPLLLVPASLIEKTRRDFAMLRDHWCVDAEPEIRSYQWMGRVGAAEFLETFKPDIIIADEAQKLRNPSAAVTRRVFRYLAANPSTVFVPMSGTLFGRSLMDAHHMFAAALGAEKMPLPAKPTEAKMWARAVDEKTSIRSAPGALELLLEPGEPVRLETIRRAVGKRIQETAGVISRQASDIGASIELNVLRWPVPVECREHLRTLLTLYEAPNGDETTPADGYRHARTLCCGFYYEWDPPPPWEWMDARRFWNRFVRGEIESERFDSELQVAQACALGRLESGGTWEAWKEIRGTFEPNSIPKWESDEILNRIIDHTADEPTIIWVEHTALGERLAELSGMPYFHRMGRDEDGVFIDDHTPDQGSMIASIASNAEGRNLQAWDRMLVVPPPANGKTWQQMLGRLHRMGQLADEIRVDVVIQHGAIRSAMRQALADARFIYQTTSQTQKLLLADCTEEI
jgi:hypothetical protein